MFEGTPFLGVKAPQGAFGGSLGADLALNANSGLFKNFHFFSMPFCLAHEAITWLKYEAGTPTGTPSNLRLKFFSVLEK